MLGAGRSQRASVANMFSKLIGQFTAPEVPMGFNLADFKLRTDIVPGKVATLQLTPDKIGSFTFCCDVFCGAGHEDMNGTLVVS